jgi:hypothetical protein
MSALLKEKLLTETLNVVCAFVVLVIVKLIRANSQKVIFVKIDFIAFDLQMIN